MPVIDYLPSFQDKGTPTTLIYTKKNKRSQSSIYHHHQPFKVAHQVVSIDVDLATRTIIGSTELTVIPTDPGNRIIKLDARYMDIQNVYVNDRRVSFLYNDMIQLENARVVNRLDAASESIERSVFQHHLYKKKMNYLYSGTDTKELVVFLPDKMKITLQEAGAFNALTPVMRDSPGSYKTPNNSEMIYTPISVRIDYRCKNPKDGVCFVGGALSALPKLSWHAYTLNSLIGVSTSSWVPCVDNLWERCTWKVSVSVPRTIGDLDTAAVATNMMPQDDDDLDRELVVCASDLLSVKDEPHPSDPSKKVTSFALFSPVSPHHVGWAVGPFEQVTLDSLEEERDDDIDMEDKDTTAAVKGVIYSLKERRMEAVNTCIILGRAIEFYSREFGSFPLSSYSVVFVSSAAADSCGFAGLTVHSDRLLYSPSEIDPAFETTEKMAAALAKQWSGINVLPRSYEDLWVTIGIALYMTGQFIKSLMGHNEFKFRIKTRADKVCDEDVGKPPLAGPSLSFPVNENKDLEFVQLKSPLVLFILNRRMTKTDKSLGLSRVIPKIFLEAMSGDLPYGIDGAHFQHVTEKVNHSKLESFFRQWVYGSGTPVFRITQRFNKKRMFIEMGIRQVQADEAEAPGPDPRTFVDDACAVMGGAQTADRAPTVFTGPMTIRIHEADGTPYEHIVNLKDTFTKLDIQYNTKYKRLKRRQAQQHEDKAGASGAGAGAATTGTTISNSAGPSGPTEDSEQVLQHCLGDTLQSAADRQKWGLADWSRDHEDRMSNEAFEWIRVDADFEWICKIYINQADYMFLLQLQQDRDVEAQYESVKYFATVTTRLPVYTSILVRTLMDARYYYGIRIEAARALLGYSTGPLLVMKAFRTLFCFDTESNIPLPNDFSDLRFYFVQKALPDIVAQAVDEHGNCPAEVETFLFDLLRYNDNGPNQFTDSFYVCGLIRALVAALLRSPSSRVFLNKIVLELDRCLRMDEWIPSYHRQVSVAVLDLKVRLAQGGMLELAFEDLLPYTRASYDDDVRLSAFSGVLGLGGLHNALLLTYILKVCELDASEYLRDRLITLLCYHVAAAGIIAPVQQPADTDIVSETLIVVEDAMAARHDALGRTSVEGVIKLLRREYGNKSAGLQKVLWDAVHSPLLGVGAKKTFFKLCTVLFEPSAAILVTLPVPRDKMLIAKHIGGGKVVVLRQNKFKIQLNKKIALKILTKINSDTKSSKVLRSAVGHTGEGPEVIDVDSETIDLTSGDEKEKAEHLMPIDKKTGSKFDKKNEAKFEKKIGLKTGQKLDKNGKNGKKVDNLVDKKVEFLVDQKVSSFVDKKSPNFDDKKLPNFVDKKSPKIGENNKTAVVRLSKSTLSQRKSVVTIKTFGKLSINAATPKVVYDAKHGSLVVKVNTTRSFLTKLEQLKALKALDRSFLSTIRGLSITPTAKFQPEVRKMTKDQLRYVKINFKHKTIHLNSELPFKSAQNPSKLVTGQKASKSLVSSNGHVKIAKGSSPVKTSGAVDSATKKSRHISNISQSEPKKPKLKFKLKSKQ